MFSKNQSESGSRNGKPKLVRVESCLYRMEPYGTYYGMVKRRGKVIRESLKTSDFKLAKRRLVEEFLKKADGLKAGSASLTFKQLANEFSKRVLDAKDLKPRAREYRDYCLDNLFRSWRELATIPVRKITKADCEIWFARRREKISPNLLNNELGTLKMILDFAVEEGVIMKNPAIGIKRVKIVKNELVIPTREQFIQLIQKMKSEVSSEAADFVELLAYSGMRRNEAASVTWGHIDWKRDQFLVTGGEQGTKNREIRYVPLFPPLKNLLERLRTATSSNSDTIMPFKQCRDSIKTACKKAKLSHFSHHSMRHFFTSNAIEQGVDFKVIAAWLGHKDGGILVAKLYGHLRQQHSQSMAQKMTFDASA